MFTIWSQVTIPLLTEGFKYMRPVYQLHFELKGPAQSKLHPTVWTTTAYTQCQCTQGHEPPLYIGSIMCQCSTHKVHYGPLYYTQSHNVSLTVLHIRSIMVTVLHRGKIMVTVLHIYRVNHGHCTTHI